LISKGEDERQKKARADLLDIVEETLRSVDPYRLVKGAIQLKDDRLLIGPDEYDLEEFEHIYLAGAGKACVSMAQAASEVLGEHATGGVFNVPQPPEGGRDDRFLFHVAGHPTPDEAGMQGARQILSMAQQAGPKDLFIMLISGGGSALLSLPAEGITLEDLKALTSLLLASGATINEVNSVRKHVSGIKGGRLAQAAFPARVVSLILSDVVGDPVDSIASGPTAPDPSTFAQCIAILKAYEIYDRVPESVRSRLERGVGGEIDETPKPGDRVFNKVTNLVVGNNRIALEAARRASEARGYRALVLTDRMEGEAREIGVLAASILNSVSASDLPTAPPCAIILGGETTVTVRGGGKGGRNQELALSASHKISGDGILLSLATDGRDGPTDSAGAMVDGRTWREAESLGADPDGALRENDSYGVLKAVGCHLFTGYTGTNVCDVLYLLVPRVE